MRTVKRPANCASTHYCNGTRPNPIGDDSTGAKPTACDGAASDSYWDGEHLLGGSESQDINGRRVSYRSDRSCPPKRGYQFITAAGDGEPAFGALGRRK
ncbi:hypothetical protein [Streptomyces sp. NBC_01314]|uniref:hypothetical protein n=1 Tax=Streptomyces sp. NBC_01314 TaxID=2903821 RepID=UPI00308C03E1|nr:hypothetical protein OG622_21720 [Streptomyces sp. NBC_01314]